MKERIIFLDFDGVLVTRRSLMALKNLPRGMEGRRGEQFAADPDCVAALNAITDATCARIVVSSTWRLDKSRADLRELLASWGVKGLLIDKTPRLIERSGSILIAQERGVEIQKWLDDYPRGVEAFVILDDDSDMGPLLPRLVKTSMDGGLTMEHARRAIEMFRQAASSQNGVTLETTGLSNASTVTTTSTSQKEN